MSFTHQEKIEEEIQEEKAVFKSYRGGCSRLYKFELPLCKNHFGCLIIKGGHFGKQNAQFYRRGNKSCPGG